MNIKLSQGYLVWLITLAMVLGAAVNIAVIVALPAHDVVNVLEGDGGLAALVIVFGYLTLG